MNKEAEKKPVQPVINGTFSAQRFFNTLALILSNREGVTISVTVTQEEKPPRNSTVRTSPEPPTGVYMGGWYSEAH